MKAGTKKQTKSFADYRKIISILKSQLIELNAFEKKLLSEIESATCKES